MLRAQQGAACAPGCSRAPAVTPGSPTCSAEVSFIFPRKDSRSPLRLSWVAGFNDNCVHCSTLMFTCLCYQIPLWGTGLTQHLTPGFILLCVSTKRPASEAHCVCSCPASFPRSQKCLIKLLSQSSSVSRDFGVFYQAKHFTPATMFLRQFSIVDLDMKKD